MLQGPGTDRAALDRIRDALSRGLPVREEVLNYARDGRPYWIELDIVPVGEGRGHYTHHIAVQRDITARKEAERALAASREELEAFTRMLQRAAEASHRIAQAHTPGKTLQLVVEEVRAVLAARSATVRLNAAGGAVAVSSGDVLPPDGGPGTLTIPLVTPAGQRIGVLQLAGQGEGTLSEGEEYVALELAQVAAIAIENAELFAEVWELNTGLEVRIAERTAQLEQQEARYRALAEQAPEVVWNVDAEGHATFLSKAWYELVGGRPEDWLGQGWIRRIHPDDMPSVVLNWQRSRETLQPYSGMRRVRARDGRWRTMSYRATPVLDDAGRPISWVGIDSDVTDFKMVEEALRTSNQELEAFSYSVSHDLRAPLSAIGGFSQALAHRLEGQLDERSRHYLARVQAGVEKMVQLIDALLSLSSVVRTPLSFAPVDLSSLARETLEGLQVAAPDRRVEVVVQDGLLASGDARLIRVLLDNLLGNAWKFTSQQPRARIELGMTTGGEFYVRDNGVGFDMAYAGKLFGPFQRLHSEAEFPGTGIGLATVQRIVARHQGRIRAESKPREGTTLLFTLGATHSRPRAASESQAA
jgi:PAS domain S-box-containing protein